MPFWGVAAKAQVGLTPLVLELKAERGQALGMITVNNTTQTAFRARIYTSPFTYDRNKGFQSLSTIPNDLTPYLQFSPRELVVPPGTNRRIRLIVRFPPSLPDGEYRTALFTENLERVINTDGKGRTIGLATRVATAVYVRKGDIVPALAIDSASVSPQRNQLFLLLRNTGLASVRPSITWSLKQGDAVVQKGEVQASTVIAATERNLALNKVLPPDAKPAGNEPPVEKTTEATKTDLPTPFILAPGPYQLIGTLTWDTDDKKQTLPFSLNLTVPSSAATSSK